MALNHHGADNQMLTPSEATRKIIDAATKDTDYSSTLNKKLVLPFFRSWQIQPLVAAWMEYAIPELIRQKTAAEANELALMLKPLHLDGEEADKYRDETYFTKISSLYAAADVFLTAFSLMHPIMLRFEELCVEDKGAEASKQKELFEESAGFYRLCKSMDVADKLVDPVLEGRYTFGNRESLASASALKERADDMLESLLRMRHNISDYEKRKEEIEDQFRFSVAARVSAAIVVLEMMQKNADWLVALAKEIVHQKGQNKRLFNRRKGAAAANDAEKSAEQNEPVSDNVADRLIEDLFLVADKAAEPGERAAEFFFS